MKQAMSYDELPEMLSARDISKHLGISLGSSYKLLKSGDIPVTIVGKRMIVARESYIEWLENNTNRRNENE